MKNLFRIIKLARFPLGVFFIGILILGTVSCSRQPYKVAKPNILFLMLDTLRADHLSGYGYERPTTPVLDRFALENLKFNNAITAAPWTPASVASMFTGMYPSAHGMMPPNDRDITKQAAIKLSSEHLTLAETLKDNGYRTAGVSPNPWITEEFGFTQGFDQFYFINRKIAEKITESGREIINKWLESSNQEPFFLYLHFLDPHDPYEPPPPYDKKFTGELKNSPFTYDENSQKMINLYDGEINYLDTELGKFFDYLKAKGLFEDLFIIIVSDHGEQFLEHGDQRHGYKLFNEEVHIPLLIKTGRDSDKSREVKETVSTIDLYPTILSRLGIKPSTAIAGISLLDENSRSERTSVLSEIRRIYDQKSVTSDDGKRLIMDLPYNEKTFNLEENLSKWRNPNIIGLFDTWSDYACVSPLKNDLLQEMLRSAFIQLHDKNISSRVASHPSDTTEITDETLEQLKSLGYLQ